MRHRGYLGLVSIFCLSFLPIACTGNGGGKSALPPPSTVGAVPGASEVTITWSAVVGATSYNIYWATSPGVTKSTGTPITGATSPHLHTALANGTTYYYTVTTLLGAVEGRESAEVSATPADPSPPTGVVATPGVSEVTIDWQPVPGATSYNLYWATAPGVTRATGNPVADVAAPYVHGGLTNGTRYYYVLTSVVGTTEGAESAEVSATPASLPPPTGVTAVAGDREVTIDWQPVPGATSYNIYWAFVPGVKKTSGIQIVGATAPHVHIGLLNGMTYYYVVTSLQGAVEGWESAEVSATPGTPIAGVLDTTFDADGCVTHDSAAGGSGGDHGRAVVVDGGGKIVVAGYSQAAVGGHDMVVWRFNNDGTLDTTFNGQGYLVDANAAGGGADDEGWGVALDSRGRILVTGRSEDPTLLTRMVVWCLEPGGVLDASFGNGGLVLFGGIAGGGGDDVGWAITTDASDRILVGGSSVGLGGTLDMVIWRLDSTGALDVSFGTGGVAIHDDAAGGGGDDEALAIALDGAGRVIAAGYSDSSTGTGTDMVAWRYSTGGTLDPTFDGTGIVTHHDAAGGDADDLGNGVTVDPVGRVIVAGSSAGASADDMVIWQHELDGAPDLSFGQGGVAVHDGAAGGGGADAGLGVVIDASWRSFVCGSSLNGSGDMDMVVWAYDPNGVLIPAFGSGGVTVHDNAAGGGGGDLGWGIAVDGVGRLIVAGSSWSSSLNPDLAVWRIR